MARWVGGEWEQREGGWHGGRAMWYGDGGGRWEPGLIWDGANQENWKRRSVTP